MLMIEKLNHTYPNGVRALEDVDLEIPKGMFGLLGPNGAGKSSLLRTVATLQQPSSGVIHFNDIDVLKEAGRLRQILGYLPQEFGVYSRGSAQAILEHIAILKGILNRRERRSVVERLLHLTNLFDARKRRLATFSGGMLRRFGIAQALIGSPELLIVDEPTAGLDPEERIRFYNLLSEIGEDRVVILSTHILEDVSELCSSLAIMSGGKVLAQGTPSALIAGIEGFMWEKTIDKSELKEYELKYELISQQMSVGKLLLRVMASENPGDGFSSAPANLEDVYFATVNNIGAGNSEVQRQSPINGTEAGIL